MLHLETDKTVRIIKSNDTYLTEIETLHHRATDVRKRGLARELLSVGYSIMDVVGFLHKIFDTAIPKAKLETMRKGMTVGTYSETERELHRLQHENAYMKDQLLAEKILTEVYKKHRHDLITK